MAQGLYYIIYVFFLKLDIYVHIYSSMYVANIPGFVFLNAFLGKRLFIIRKIKIRKKPNKINTILIQNAKIISDSIEQLFYFLIQILKSSFCQSDHWLFDCPYLARWLTHWCSFFIQEHFAFDHHNNKMKWTTATKKKKTSLARWIYVKWIADLMRLCWWVVFIFFFHFVFFVNTTMSYSRME